MDSDTRSAHRRVGAVAIAAFLALLLLGLSRGPASANQETPAASPTAAPSQQIPDFDRDRDGDGGGPRRGFRGGGGSGFGGGGDPDGGGVAPAPSAPTTPSTPTTPSAPSTGTNTT
jgi:hypothetical protein